ncbi:MAG: Phosphoribosylglycinamide formyltransferase, partial [uncultured Nocardioidaceae bacterium]
AGPRLRRRHEPPGPAGRVARPGVRRRGGRRGGRQRRHRGSRARRASRTPDLRTPRQGLREPRGVGRRAHRVVCEAPARPDRSGRLHEADRAGLPRRVRWSDRQHPPGSLTRLPRDGWSGCCTGLWRQGDRRNAVRRGRRRRQRACGRPDRRARRGGRRRRVAARADQGRRAGHARAVRRADGPGGLLHHGQEGAVRPV